MTESLRSSSSLPALLLSAEPVRAIGLSEFVDAHELATIDRSEMTSYNKK